MERGWNADFLTDRTWVGRINENCEELFKEGVRQKHPNLQGDALEKRILELGKAKKICVSEKESRAILINTLMLHLEHHPFVHCGWRDAEALTREDPREMWVISTEEMYRFCRELGESWAWEYLWKNWYRPDRWTIWARAISPKLPIIHSNGIVESLWSVLKKQHLRKHNRPKMEFLISIIMDEYLPRRTLMVQQHRLLRFGEKPIKPVWYSPICRSCLCLV
jgi:hypothetical protein